jgi:hypothetical protein
MSVRLCTILLVIAAAACSPPAPPATASDSRATPSPPVYGNSKSAPSTQTSSGSNYGTCPKTANEQVQKATASGIYRAEIDAGGAQIFISRSTAETIGSDGLELLALYIDCAAAGPDGILKSVMIRSAPGETPFQSFSPSELMELRRKHERLGLQ